MTGYRICGLFFGVVNICVLCFGKFVPTIYICTWTKRSRYMHVHVVVLELAMTHSFVMIIICKVHSCVYMYNVHTCVYMCLLVLERSAS